MFSNKKNYQKGLSLVEMVITMSIASALMLAISEISLNTLRTSRNITTVSDWQNLVSILRLAINNDSSCQRIIEYFKVQGVTTYDYDSTLGAGPTITINQANPLLTNIAMTTSVPGVAGAPTFNLIDTNPNAYTNFIVNTITINKQNPNETPSNIPLTDQTDGDLKTFLLHNLRMNITATKRVIGANANMGSNDLTINVPIDFQIITGPARDMDGRITGTDHNLSGCFGVDNSVQAACIALGGKYLAAPLADQTQCVIENISFFGGNAGNTSQGSSQGDPNMNGERLQLQGRFAAATNPLQRSISDTAIGVNTNEFWFNLGGNGNQIFSGAGNLNQYTWHWAEVGNAAANNRYLMALDSGGNLLINPGNLTNTNLAAGAPTNPVLGFGFNNSGGNLVPTEFITSERTNGSNRFGDLEFTVFNQTNVHTPALAIMRNGEFRFENPNAPGNNSIRLEFGANTLGQTVNTWIESQESGSSRNFQFVTNVNTAAIPQNFSLMTLNESYVETNRPLVAYGSVIALNAMNTTGPVITGQPVALFVRGPAVFRDITHLNQTTASTTASSVVAGSLNETPFIKNLCRIVTTRAGAGNAVCDLATEYAISGGVGCCNQQFESIVLSSGVTCTGTDGDSVLSLPVGSNVNVKGTAKVIPTGWAARCDGGFNAIQRVICCRH